MTTAPAGQNRARARGNASDGAGAVILAACAIWSLISAAGRETGPEGVLLALLAVAAGFTCGRICGTLLPVATATIAAAGALLMGLLSRHGMPGATATVDTAPGHAGAAAALLVLAAGAACCAAAAARQAPLRCTLRVLALGAACAALSLRSVAGFAAALGVLLCSLAAARMRQRLLGLAGLALAAGLAVATSWAVAADALPQGLMVSLEGPLTPNRVLLWQDALELAGEHPVLGVGPGRFAELSPTVEQTVHSDGKPHSAPWQQAAEQGVVGVVLLGSAFGWLLYVLWRSPRTTAVVLAAGAALTALAMLASVGNALSFTPVTAGAGLLAGLASARRPIGYDSAGPDDEYGTDGTDGTRRPGDGRQAPGPNGVPGPRRPRTESRIRLRPAHRSSTGAGVRG
ncbi:O-antigen ligase family protein [Streptomyces sp. NBC_00846]|uniref:O-antigen ligase family protein n=1 Tax=Streptomyces sp. NBC_00846 TaxID=2975849 RepID=UPI00386E5C6D|nr:O-antigen ligase family protein [Streptomyces sp. NBC_00846]